MTYNALKPISAALLTVFLTLSIAPAEAAPSVGVAKGPKGDRGPRGLKGPKGDTGPGYAESFDFRLGDRGPGGGFIFFVDYYDQYPEFDYLEAAPADASGITIWCDVDKTTIPEISGWSANAVGRGQANTKIMLKYCSEGAANVVDAYKSPNGTADWFLPSEGEAMLMYTNLRQAGVGDFADEYYWSSTDGDSGAFAWTQNFSNGTQLHDDKDDPYNVRAIRAF